MPIAVLPARHSRCHPACPRRLPTAGGFFSGRRRNRCHQPSAARRQMSCAQRKPRDSFQAGLGWVLDAPEVNLPASDRNSAVGGWCQGSGLSYSRNTLRRCRPSGRVHVSSDPAVATWRHSHQRPLPLGHGADQSRMSFCEWSLIPKADVTRASSVDSQTRRGISKP